MVQNDLLHAVQICPTITVNIWWMLMLPKNDVHLEIINPNI